MKKIMTICGAMLIASLTFTSCKSKNEKKAEQLMDKVNNLKTELIKTPIIDRKLIKNYSLNIESLKDSLNSIRRDEKINGKKIIGDIYSNIEKLNTMLDSVLGIYSINLMKGHYNGEGKQFFLVKNWGYMDFGSIATDITINPNTAVKIFTKDSFGNEEEGNIKLVNIKNESDTLITGDCEIAENGSIYCAFTWRQNNIILKRTYDTNASGTRQTISWESENSIAK